MTSAELDELERRVVRRLHDALNMQCDHVSVPVADVRALLSSMRKHRLALTLSDHVRAARDEFAEHDDCPDFDCQASSLRDELDRAIASFDAAMESQP